MRRKMLFVSGQQRLELALEAKVSGQAVWRVYSNAPHVSERMRARVRAAAERLGLPRPPDPPRRPSSSAGTTPSS